MITENDWRTLITKIRDGYCTPFIGAGTAYPYLPLGAELAQMLIADEERHGTICPLEDRSDLARVTQFLAVTKQDAAWPKLRIAKLINSAQPPPLTNEDDPHRVLADLQLPVYLTTNYDDFLVRALKQKIDGRGEVRREFARWTEDLRVHDSAFDGHYDPTPSSPVVFHLHGHAGYPLSMVATEDDYLDFMVNMSQDLGATRLDPTLKTILPPRIRRAIKTTTLLFVGYGLNDLNFRVILRGLVNTIQPNGRQIHVAVQYAGRSSKELLEYLESYFKWTLDINVIWGTAAEFCEQLRSKWQSGGE